MDERVSERESEGEGEGEGDNIICVWVKMKEGYRRVSEVMMCVGVGKVCESMSRRMRDE